MNIAFISSGNSIHVKKLANGLIENGHKVTLYTLPNHTSLIDQFNDNVKIDILTFGGKKGYYLNVRELRKKLISNKFDLINCHYISGYGTLARLTKIRPLVASVFGSDVYDYPFRSKLNMKRIMKNLDASNVILSTSQVMVNKLREFYKAERLIFVTHFGVDTNIFKPIKVNKSNSQEFTFGIVKKLEDKYGIGILIEAFGELVKKNKSNKKLQLQIYGRGSQENKYKELSKKLGIDDKVYFNGFIKNELIPEAFSRIDVVCLPSISESFGVSAIEAMACAVPLIVSDAPGFTEIVKNNETGFIVPKGNLEELIEKMRICVEMPSEDLKKIGVNGRNRVLKMFDFNDNIQTYINAISVAVEQGK